MHHDVREWVGPELQAGPVAIRPVARADAVWHTSRRWGGSFVYVRPNRIEVVRPEHEPQLVPIPDRQLQVRLAAIALVIAAFVVGRIRRGRN